MNEKLASLAVESPLTRPHAAVVSVGDELLAGEVVDVNASWIARELEDIGFRVEMMATLPDDRQSIGRFISWARRSFDAVVITGGLGGTPDDVTRDGIADAFGVERVVDEARTRESRARGGHAAVYADEWNRLPEGSRVLSTLDGGAPPFTVGNVYVFAGANAEMKAAFESVRSELRRGSALSIWRARYETTEDELVGLLAAVQSRYPTVRLGSYPAPAGSAAVELVLRGNEPLDVRAAAALLQRMLHQQEIRQLPTTSSHQVGA